MDAKKREKRNEIKSIKTKREYCEYMDSLMLTPEQRTICDLMFVYGLTYSQIGEKIHCSESTVKWKVQKIFDKLI